MCQVTNDFLLTEIKTRNYAKFKTLLLEIVIVNIFIVFCLFNQDDFSVFVHRTARPANKKMKVRNIKIFSSQ